jgi:Zn-dependent metalloprotease
MESREKRLRDIAYRTLSASARFRERRSILGRLHLAAVSDEERRSIYDCNHTGSNPPTGTLVRSEGDGASSDKAVNEAYDGLGATYDLYKEVFNRNSIDDRGLELKAYVHFDQDYDNAFWDGQEMVFGDGDNVLFTGFTGAIDVIGHELTHGVTQYTAALDYHDQPGALNESFSDVFGSLVKQHYLKQDVNQADWLIGKGILAPGINGVALRSMKDPGSAYDDPKMGGKDPQPGHMDDFVHLPNTPGEDNGGVHINSGIPNHAFYLLAMKLGGNAWEDAGHIWYATLLQLWAAAQFQDCANVSFQVAGQQFGTNSKQQQAVKEAWSEVGITIAAPGARQRPAPGRKGKKAGLAEANGALKSALQNAVKSLQTVLAEL